jgi:hypothetical protein
MKKRNRKRLSADVPKVLQTAGVTINLRNGRIPHREIFRTLQGPGELVRTFRRSVLTQNTRTLRLLGKKYPARIIHTLLGYEVQASYKRIQCPDLVTARYVKLFSELGCHSIKLPYDPTLTARLIPKFESMVDDINRQITEFFPQDPSLRHYALRMVYGMIREELQAV